jgi:hypothetical protein
MVSKSYVILIFPEKSDHSQIPSSWSCFERADGINIRKVMLLSFATSPGFATALKFAGNMFPARRKSEFIALKFPNLYRHIPVCREASASRRPKCHSNILAKQSPSFALSSP